MIISCSFLMIGGFMAETKVAPVMPFAELALLLGTLVFAANAFKNAR